RPQLEPGRLTRGLLGDRGDRVVERARDVFLIEPRQQVRHAREDGQPAAPAVSAIASSELDRDPERLPRLHDEHRLGEHERKIAFEPVEETLPLVLLDILPGSRIDEDLTVAYL